MITIGPLLLKGKTKDVYAVTPEKYVLLEFRDELKGYREREHTMMPHKGGWGAGISAALFELLAQSGVPNHYVRTEGPGRLLVEKLEMFPFFVVARNLTAGSLAHRFGLPEGTPLLNTIVEYYPKDVAIGKQWVNASHIRAFDWATEKQLKTIRRMTDLVNETLVPYLEEKGLVLVDFRLEFGVRDGEVFLGNELSPDNLRLWDLASSETLDGDRLRQGVEQAKAAYFEIYRRICLNE